jgi:hypothetical protein
VGCDIHCYAEVFNEKTGKWEYRGGFPCEWCGGTGKSHRYDPEKKEDVEEPCWFCGNERKKSYEEDGIPYVERFYSSRSYYTFSILADVRNGRGFAGCQTGEGFNPICLPKGMPEDASPEVAAECERWEGDGHSHTWHTLADLLAFDWKQVTRNCGVVHAKVYDAWRKAGRKGSPSCSSGGVSGRDIVEVSNSEMDSLLDSGALQAELNLENEWAGPSGMKKHFTLVWWEEGYDECVRGFLKRIELLKGLGVPPEHVRLVMWFDN